MRTGTAKSAMTDAVAFRDEIARRYTAGERFAGLFATEADGGIRLTAALAHGGAIDLLDTILAAGVDHYPSITAVVPPAFWYEREIHDVYAVRADGHPRLDPLIHAEHAVPVPRHVTGTGIFTIPHGPVRSGVVESVEYLVETPGEDIPHLRVRPHYKHRGLEKRFISLDARTGLLLAERVEGIATVAHALAYAHAVEALCGIPVPRSAELIRVIHAELERIANHLDVATRLSDAAALAVATARFGWHKEQVLRLRGQLCGSRFGRGVVAIGGVRGSLALPLHDVLAALDALERAIRGDERAVMVTPSFLDRLRATGPLTTEVARRHGALGPIGRASGSGEDVRATRAYDGYGQLDVQVASDTQQDAQARLRVRWAELHESFRLIRSCLSGLNTLSDEDRALRAGRELLRQPLPDGRGLGWAEAAQGEVLYLVEAADGRLKRVKPRSASFHNLVLFHSVFAGDIFTDFPFIEASFGVSIAGVSS